VFAKGDQATLFRAGIAERDPERQSCIVIARQGVSQ
jgi:hypothetical protein